MKEILSYIKAKEIASEPSFIDEMKKKFKDRYEMAMTPVHLLAYLL